MNIIGEMLGFLFMSAGTVQDTTAANTTTNTRWKVLIMSSSPHDGHWTTKTAGVGCRPFPQDGHCRDLDV